MFIRGSLNFLPLEDVCAEQSILVAYAVHSGKKPTLNRLLKSSGGGGSRPPLRFSEIFKAGTTKI